MQAVKITRWGPGKLQEIVKQLQDGINARTPLESKTISLEERPDGIRICLKDSETDGDEIENSVAGGGSNGTPVDIYGAVSGVPSVFHLFQSSAATPI